MATKRCPKCYRPIRNAFHWLECEAERPKPKQPKVRDEHGRVPVPPSRASRKPRAEYLESRRVSDEQRRANARARQARYRENKRKQQQ